MRLISFRYSWEDCAMFLTTSPFPVWRADMTELNIDSPLTWPDVGCPIPLTISGRRSSDLSDSLNHIGESCFVKQHVDGCLILVIIRYRARLIAWQLYCHDKPSSLGQPFQGDLTHLLERLGFDERSRQLAVVNADLQEAPKSRSYKPAHSFLSGNKWNLHVTYIRPWAVHPMAY